ncbi:MAG TPA: DegT/DnrJ/EryC1/StrS family aminotransferase [Anaerolineales bacterium]|nr:DegT/DnrJ/EryC1/StrS family aminotransferase [Anaerolineales bacterium]
MNKIPSLFPMSSPDLGDAEREAVQDVLHTPNLSMGPRIDQFESAICRFTGSKNAIAVNSGTSGLHLCVRASDIKSSDYVITSPFSFVASTNVILFENAIPIYVDIDPITGNIDTNLLRSAVNDLITGGKVAENWLPRKGGFPGGNLKAILPIDVFGQPADLDPIMEIARHQGLKVIEDSCEALGAEYKGRKAGSIGDFGVFAFYPNKQITTGEGGVVVTDDDNAADLMRSLRNQGRAVGDTWLQHTHLGYNYRMDEMSAALGNVQLSRIEELLSKREQVAAWYTERLSEIPGIETQSIHSNTTRMSWFVYVIRFAEGINRDEIASKIEKSGVPARPYFVPIHLQPYMVDRFSYQAGDFPSTEDLGNRSLAIPFSGIMTESQVEEICRIIHSSL